MHRVMDIPDSLFISYYIYGLKLHLQREFLVSKPTTIGDVFSLARIIKARLDDQAAPVAVSELEMKVLVDGKQDEAKVVKVVVVAVEQNIDEPDVEEEKDGGCNSKKNMGSRNQDNFFRQHLEDKVISEGEKNVTPRRSKRARSKPAWQKDYAM
ncbi:hypothetical protein Tco_0601777 [Tanacetum coccineum]